MLTNTHILIAAAALTRPRFSKSQNLIVIFGGLFPDLSVFIMALVGRLPGSEVANLWRKPDGMYWQEPWQFLSALSNSIPLYIVALLVFMFLVRRQRGFRGLWLAFALFSAACLMHVLFDLPVHADDAHVHFWPLTGERFHSPISYWQSQFHGNWVSAFEVVLGLLCATVIWRRFGSLLPRLGLFVLALPYVLAIGFLLRRFVI
ncbi:hypothetical protein [Maritalea porphyrae]|jgi:hypothetical protein|uniref:hypothetical protein n=1 Tax=Maritalea porphyrae TaxID=880732 RepID=UPI0022AE697F|nr:hypothetical protein [Maritalea porphyrae]MCZ4274102.1 hypothetical protein [Maritalea porphyrae]